MTRGPLTWDDADVARFMSYVDVLPDGCWLWTGARSRGAGNRQWYGSFWCQGQSVRAHRFSDRALGGRPELPPGWHRDHACCRSLCVNWEHLEGVPHAVNQARKVARAALGKKIGRSVVNRYLHEPRDVVGRSDQSLENEREINPMSKLVAAVAAAFCLLALTAAASVIVVSSADCPRGVMDGGYCLAGY